MPYTNDWALIDDAWLATRLDDPAIRIVDASWFLPTIDRTGAQSFAEAHIPGAVFFDIDEVCTRHPTLPHMAPTATDFAAKVGAMGISNDHKVVVYDANGGFCAAVRVWWMFHLFGHQDVCLLNGGLPHWVANGHPVQSGTGRAVQTTEFSAVRQNDALIRTADQVLANTETQAEQLIDARSPGRFAGSEPEPRPSPRAGRIPGSINIPFGALMDGDNHFMFHPAQTLTQVFDNAGVNLEKPVAASCGSGVTACVPAFALFLLGKTDVAVYDGSWAEWGDRTDLPIQGQP